MEICTVRDACFWEEELYGGYRVINPKYNDRHTDSHQITKYEKAR